jgi:hypothetical protein
MPRETARRAFSSDWFEHAIRFGHAAKGLVFGTIGFLAARMAVGDVTDAPDFAGALEHLAEQPLNFLFLGVLIFGLLAYASWRLAQSLAGMPEASGAIGLARRTVVLVTGLTYGGFAIYAIALLFGIQRGDEGIEEETAVVMHLPYGQWIVGVIGAGVALAGLFELFIAFTARFREEFNRADMHRIEKLVAFGFGWWGHTARGVIYVTAGFIAVRSAVRFDPDEAAGFADTLWELGQGDYGTLALGFVAAGLISFGVYSMMLALHRHIPDPDTGQPEDRLP